MKHEIAWSLFTAATISDIPTRETLISSIRDQFFNSQPKDTAPFPANYNVDGTVAAHSLDGRYVQIFGSL